MSGESIKCVRVEEVALRRLSKKPKQLSAASPEIQEKVSTIEQETQKNFLAQLAKLRERAQSQQAQSEQLKSPLATLEKKSLANLQKQQESLQNTLKETANAPTPEIRYQTVIKIQSQQFKPLQGQEKVSLPKLETAKIAQDLLADIQKIALDIEKNYPHERFAPQRLASLNRQIAMSESNLQAGLQEAVIAGAQQTYLALVDLRLELEQKEQEFLLAYNIAAQGVKESLVKAEAVKQYPLVLEEEETFEIDVDYWSQGRLQEHINNLEELYAQLKQSANQLSLAQVQEINKAIAQEQSKREAIIEQARLALLSSQMRVEIADLVVSSLEDLGYTLVNPDTDALYAENDQRNAYVVKVKNLAGDEVVTIIKPEADFGSNVVSINAFSEVLVDEKAAQQNAQGIFASLEAAGIEGSGEFTCKSKAQEKYRNPQEIKQRDLAQPS